MPWAHCEPAGHVATHVAAPAEEYVPLVHATHAELDVPPALALNVPAAHCRHLVPAASVYVPARHCTHDSEEKSAM